MNSYICVTYAQDDREVNDLFCRSLSRYGFRFQCVNELSDPVKRRGWLTEASLLIALTSPAAVRAETVAADIRRALERNMRVLCISLEDNELDIRFCAVNGGGIALIPFPVGETPDRHSVALFIHRLFVRHLTRLGECFVENRCAYDGYGTVIRMAYHAYKGEGAACYAVGRAYEEGELLPPLENEAATWMKLAARQNVPDALIRMGLFHLMGKGTERNLEAAFSLFQRAAQMGDPRGDYRMGLCYLDGLGVVKDPEYAVTCIARAADAKVVSAMVRLGCLYFEGVGTPRNLRLARKYLYQACLLGSAEGDWETPVPTMYGRRPGRYACVSMRYLRHTRLKNHIRHANGGKESPEQPARSTRMPFGRVRYERYSLPEDAFKPTLAELYTAEQPTRSEAREEIASAAFMLGRLLSEGDLPCGKKKLYPCPTASLRWYRYAAYLGHTEALCALGDAYRRGWGAPIMRDPAAELYRLAARSGSVRGAFAYAVCCERGIGVDRNMFMAVDYYRKAADQGYAPALNNLGGCYEAGRGVVRNELKAVELYSRAAAAGVADAACRLGMCYEMGRGVETDPAHALRLYESAASEGHAHALYRLGLYYHKRAHERDEDIAGVVSTENLSRSASLGTTDVDTMGVASAVSLLSSEETLVGVSDRLQALSLYRRAVEGGSSDAAYALYLCRRKGYGVALDGKEEMEYLNAAALGGCLQAMYELALCAMEGRGMPRDPRIAVSWFRAAVREWRARREDPRWINRDRDRGALPPGGMPAYRAAGGALYMLGYCALYDIGMEAYPTAVDFYAPPSPERVDKAVPYFREAAENQHVGALTMLGDLCAFGLVKPSVSTSEDESLDYYLEADRVASERVDHGTATGERTDSSVDALMSLADRALRAASVAEDPGDAVLARANAWKSLSEAARLGSADALVGMAECLFHGQGTDCNRPASLRMLRRASALDGGRAAASMWLGDFLRSQWGNDPVPEEADDAYMSGLRCGVVESECGPYTFGLRRKLRREADVSVQTEICYRLATLRATCFGDGDNRRECFPYLARAVAEGHNAALDDLARIYQYEINHPRVLMPEDKSQKPRTHLPVGSGARVRRKLRKGMEDPTRSDRAAHMHHNWLVDYYTALWPEPKPFSREMRSLFIPRDVPEHVYEPVTPLMRVNALCYLGECYFEGHGLAVSPEAAYACFSAAVNTRLPVERGQPMPVAMVNAIYSLGWCMLYGVGTTADPGGAVRMLNRVAKSHSGAAYTLGVCHEEGRGVVIPDISEALKFYRKAESLGHPKAAERVLKLEKLLKNRQED